MSLNQIWKNKDKILEGIKNKYLKKKDKDKLKSIAEKRISICRTNQCGFYDKDGSSKKAVIKGLEACSGCGCNLEIKGYSLSSHCYLKDIGEKPLWEEENLEK